MQSGQAVKNELRLRILLQELIELLARRHVVADVDQRHRIVVMLLRRLEVQRKLFQVFVAGENVHLSPVDKCLVRPGQHFLQVVLGLLKLVFLQCAQPGFIVLHGLCVSGIFSHLFSMSNLQCHQTAFGSKFSSELKL